MKAVIEVRFINPEDAPDKKTAYVIALDQHPHFGTAKLDNSPDVVLEALATGLMSVILHLEESPDVVNGKLMATVIKDLEQMYANGSTTLSKLVVDDEGNIKES